MWILHYTPDSVWTVCLSYFGMAAIFNSETFVKEDRWRLLLDGGQSTTLKEGVSGYY